MTGSGLNTRRYAVYDLQNWSPDGQIRDLAGVHVRPHIYGNVPSPVLTVTRYYTGLGRERGGVRTSIRNNGKEPLTIAYLDIIPWYLRMYLHTLNIVTTDNKQLEPKQMHFSPGVDRTKPYHLELVLTLPPK